MVAWVSESLADTEAILAGELMGFNENLFEKLVFLSCQLEGKNGLWFMHVLPSREEKTHHPSAQETVSI